MLEENILKLAEQRLEELRAYRAIPGIKDEISRVAFSSAFLQLSQLTEMAQIKDFGLSNKAITKLISIESDATSLMGSELKILKT